MNKIFKKIFLPMLICLSIISTSLVSIAAGDGSGGGGGKSIPLVVKETSVSDGEKNVALNPSVIFTFTKNIAHEDVRDANKKLFKMISEDGKDIPIEVINADIQMEPEKRRDLTVVPKVKLIEGTTYKIIAQKGIKSKGGQFTENDKIISFTTLGEKPIKKEIKPVEIKKEENKTGVKKESVKEEIIEKTNEDNNVEENKEETIEQQLETVKLKSTNPQDGAIDVELESDIVFLFDKKVSKSEVLEENKKLFSMKKESGEDVEIVFVEKEKTNEDDENEIIVKSKLPLEEDTKYIVTASKGIKTQEGEVTEEDYTVGFTTLKNDIKEVEEVKDTKPVEIKEEKNNNKVKYIISGLVLALIISGGYIYYKRKGVK